MFTKFKSHYSDKWRGLNLQINHLTLKSKNMNILKSKYTAPEMNRIELDNEISLILQSAEPPFGPSEIVKVSPEFFNNEPFHTNIA